MCEVVAKFNRLRNEKAKPGEIFVYEFQNEPLTFIKDENNHITAKYNNITLEGYDDIFTSPDKFYAKVLNDVIELHSKGMFEDSIRTYNRTDFADYWDSIMEGMKQNEGN